MPLAINGTTAPTTDLGYLLPKHPDRVPAFDLAFGQVHVVYPEVSDECCTAAGLLDLDAVGRERARTPIDATLPCAGRKRRGFHSSAVPVLALAVRKG